MFGDKFCMRISGSRALGMLALAASIFVLSCQSSSTAPQKPSGPQSITPGFTVSPSYKAPDSAAWRFKTDSGRTALIVVKDLFQTTVTISTPLERDTLWMDVYAAGIREMRIPFIDGGNGAPKVDDKSIVYDSTALAILRRIDSLVKAGKVVARNKGGSALVYASMLLDGDALAKKNGFAKMPKGLDSTSVLDSLLSEASKAGLPLRSYATLLASVLDSNAVKIRLSVLVKSGVLSSSDSVKLFPPYPVRVSTPITMDSVLVAGGSKRSVDGSFQADRGVVSLSVRVYRDSVDATTSFEVNNTVVTDARPKILELGQNLSLRASEAASPGVYRLRLVARDDSARNAMSEFVFRVAPPADVAGPSLVWVSPLDGTIFDFVDSTLKAKIVVTDPSGVDSVWIAGKLAVKVDDTFSLQVVVPVSEAGYVLGARSVDRIGNPATSSIRLGRRDGLVRKQILSPSANATVPFDSASVVVRWKVIDPRSKVDSVWMGSMVATPENDSVWKARVPLTLSGTATVIGLTAKTARGDQLVDFISVTRDLDKTGPTLTFLAPAPGAVLEYDTETVVVKVQAADPSGVDSVLIAGIKAVLVEGVWTRSVAVAVGTSLQIHVSGYDKRANRTDTSISVTRKGPPDNLAPVIKLLWPYQKQGAVVPFDSSMVTLRWLVTDAFGINDTGVKINGKPSSRSGDTFALRVALPPSGQPLSFRIDVNNIKKGTAFDAVSLARASDTVRPKVSRVGAFPSVVLNDSSAITLTWKVTDNHRLEIQKSGDSSLSVKDSLYTVRVPLKVGSNFVVFKAWDSTGNLAGDSSIIVRAAPRPSHDLDSGHFVRYWKPLHITSTGADSIQWSLDGATWSRYKDSIRVDCDSCRILSRAWPGPSALDTTGTFWIRKVKSVAAGGYHSIFVMQNGTVWAAGKNWDGRLGDGTFDMKVWPAPVLQSGTPMTGVVKAIGGGSQSIYLKGDGSLWGAGANWDGRLGQADSMDHSIPVHILDGVADASTWYSTAALKSDGTLWVMGGNESGQLGLGDTIGRRVPTQLMDWKTIPWTGIQQVAAGPNQLAFIDSRKGLMRAGYLDTTPILSPTSYSLVGFTGTMKQICLGTTALPLMIVTNEGGLWQVGAPDQAGVMNAANIASEVVSVAQSYDFVVAQKSNGTVWVKGDNFLGSLGVGSMESPYFDSSFVQSKVPGTVSQISGGYTHIMALLQDGSVFVWGGNEHGQLAIGSSLDQSTPVQVNF